MNGFKPTDRRLHFIGIGGIGMSGIAELFLNQGFLISGSDLAASELTTRLAGMGAVISIGHRSENVHGANIVVISSAVRDSNPEIQEARRLGIPVIPRAEMLAELMRGKVGIAVAGTHGKTSTTSMLATILTDAGLDPTLVVGGKVDSLGGNARLGHGNYVIAEADESDGSFLHLPATFGIITNIDNDHLDYYGDLGAIEDAFVEFVGKLPIGGLAAVCGEDAGVRRCLRRFSKPVATYGFNSDSDYFADALSSEGMTQSFDFWARPQGPRSLSRLTKLGRVRLNFPGRHNILNALGALVIGLHLELPFSRLATGLTQFSGVKRRFEVRWQDLGRKRVIIDDYGHHPTEIAATLNAARSCWPGRIITVFQPHRYSRTLSCHDAFLTSFRQSDVVHLVDIYAAGEAPIAGVTSEALALEIISEPGQRVSYAGDLAGAQAAVLRDFRDGDLVLCLGAGSITQLPELLVAALGASSA
ncbi:MAG: UDP-N-acetylmuramate--L-alanine ligase [Bdellovibrionales bacterium GWB1_52_6]|nr:MAG: UDP-N-acetylmuramate--L-alanine ligase [Bdellovibrionales bacterium GWB1_52_6]OFZ02562.1 MAG: UDP-N-acetylmuramate--L-alanine ligase [Bdellovibrionales bacterium GWA1_52_35]HCM41412.1 UDP-N-acetylmuramate--L-alanine ligase [Bdellovibrionales bacterium]